MRKLEYWLISTEHLNDRLLFKDTEDFRVGMNFVAVQAYKCGVVVLVFILMSNHLHFIILGTREDVEKFVNGFKLEYSRYLQRKYGSREHLRRNGVDIRRIPMENEALERALAYVQMNCVAANICGSPRDYPWGTGACFFTGPDTGMPGVSAGRKPGVREPGSPAKAFPAKAGRPLAALSARERFRLVHSKAELPGEWVLSETGYILPSSYVRKDLVEKAFGSPRRMNYFLQSSSKAKMRLETGEQSLPAFKDQVIVAALPDLCWSLFRKHSVAELSGEQLVELLRQLRFRFAANVNQIARVTGLTYELVAEYLDRA